jgi:CBS domain-containing protein
MALPELERAFPKEGVRRFPVVDQDGRLAGIVSALDFVRLFADGRVASA